MSVERAIASGESVGELNVFRASVGGLPGDLTAVFVLMHVPRTAPSALPESLGRSTRLAVMSPRDGEPLEAAHVYVASPDHPVLRHGGALRLSGGCADDVDRKAASDTDPAETVCSLIGRIGA